MKSKFLFMPALLIASAVQVNSLSAQQKSEPAKATNRSFYSATTDSGETQINYTEDGRRYKIKVEGTKIIEIQIDGKNVAQEDFAKYEPAVKKILEQMEKDRQQAEKDREQAQKDRDQAEKDRGQAQKDRDRAAEDRKQAEKDREQANKNREQAQRDRERVAEDKKQAEKDREQAIVSRAQAEKDRAQAELDRKQAEEDRKLAEEDRKLAEEDRRLFRALLADAMADKLLEDEDSLKSLVLDDTEFIINGVKQSENLHSKYKEKFLKGRHTKINYRNSGNVRGMSFN